MCDSIENTQEHKGVPTVSKLHSEGIMPTFEFSHVLYPATLPKALHKLRQP